MGLPARTLALAGALALVLLAAVPAARADMGKPEWKAGDYWDYNFTGTFFNGFVFSINGPGTFRMDVVAQDTVSVGAGTYPSYRVRLTVNASGSTVFNSGEQWYRVSDLALVKSELNVTVDTFIFGRVTLLTTLTYNPPLRVVWPLASGGNWSADSNQTIVDQIPGNPPLSFPFPITSDYTVQAVATVSVPAGSFETTPLHSEGDVRATTYWAPGAGNYAREQRFAPNNAETYSAELREFRYQGTSILGLPLIVWVLLLLLIAIVVVVVMLRRRGRPMAQMPPQHPPR